MSATSEQTAREPEPWLTTLLRVCVHAITAGVIVWPLSVWAAVFAAAAGAAIGSFGARPLAASALRISTVFAGSALGLLLTLAARFVVVDLDFVAQSLGPAGAMVFGDQVVFGMGALFVSLALRTLSGRRPSAAIAEAGLVAAGFATLLLAHRNGAIHRPYELADPLISAGEDPTLAVLAIGACGAGVIGLLLLSERSLLRSAFHIVVIAALLLVILGTTTMAGLPPPPSSGGALGLQDDESEGRGGGGESNRRSSEELDFLDEYPQGGGTPDAVVLFHDDYSAPGGYYYFRQNAFSQYNGRKLVAANQRGVDADVQNVFPTTRSRDVSWTPGESDDRTHVETTVAMLAENSAPLALEAATRFVPATNPNPDRFRRLYRVESLALVADMRSMLGRRAGDASWDEATRAHYLEMPDDPRYAALAEEIVAGLPEHLREEPMARALAITQHLGQNGTYSLRSRHAGAGDPTADFLFGDLTGYCVHFAHAAVFLMRAAGLPARVGTGYAVAEANRQGGSALLLRNSDQHAWPEVFLGAAPWMEPPELIALEQLLTSRAEGTLAELDPYVGMMAERAVDAVAREIAPDAYEGEPPPDLSELMERAVVSDGYDWVAGLEDHASRADVSFDSLMEQTRAELGPPAEGETPPSAGWVVTDVAPENVLDAASGDPPDPQLQRLLGEMARGSEAIEDAPNAPRPMREFVRELTGPVLSGFGALLLGLLGLAYGIKLWRRFAPGFGAASSRPRLIYRAALDRLSEDGVRRRFGESPEAFARRERERFPGLRDLTNVHLRAAFGRAPDERALSRLNEQASALRAQHRAAVPLWRRALGCINPVSWLWTR